MDEETLDKDKVVEHLFNPDVYEILSQLEDGPKELSYLAEKSGISQTEVENRLGYLLEHGFVKKDQKENSNEKTTKTTKTTTTYFVDKDKLAKIMENEDNFGGAIDGLTKMDSYLN